MTKYGGEYVRRAQWKGGSMSIRCVVQQKETRLTSNVRPFSCLNQQKEINKVRLTAPEHLWMNESGRSRGDFVSRILERSQTLSFLNRGSLCFVLGRPFWIFAIPFKGIPFSTLHQIASGLCDADVHASFRSNTVHLLLERRWFIGTSMQSQIAPVFVLWMELS